MIEAEGLWDALLGEGGVHSCQELSESWDWPALKTFDLLGYTCTLNPSNKGEKGAAGSSVMLFIFSLCKCLLNISEIFKRFYWLLVYCMWFFSSLFSLKCLRAGKWE